ncbi:uncharacterized protein LOC135925053 isoform X2 [Gordionus sp. m RMFG-2023]|uniref:uncharacterized protein LOC135925053 isoform X2 n=1 Tax=Gordionus sp. m RMFG-2023 TaxID=3053472 RepID=UPI0031FDCDDD
MNKFLPIFLLLVLIFCESQGRSTNKEDISENSISKLRKLTEIIEDYAQKKRSPKNYTTLAATPLEPAAGVLATFFQNVLALGSYLTGLKKFGAPKIGHSQYTQNFIISKHLGFCEDSKLDNCSNLCKTVTSCNVSRIICTPEYCNGTCSAMFVDADTNLDAYCQ